jgi:hypothetical protein
MEKFAKNAYFPLANTLSLGCSRLVMSYHGESIQSLVEIVGFGRKTAEKWLLWLKTIAIWKLIKIFVKNLSQVWPRTRGWQTEMCWEILPFLPLLVNKTLLDRDIQLCCYIVAT